MLSSIVFLSEQISLLPVSEENQLCLKNEMQIVDLEKDLKKANDELILTKVIQFPVYCALGYSDVIRLPLITASKFLALPHDESLPRNLKTDMRLFRKSVTLQVSSFLSYRIRSVKISL